MTVPVADDFDSTILELRGSIAELLNGTGADVTKPQHISRILGLDKNLARKFSRIIEAPDAGEVIQNLPGEVGFNILFSAVERTGTSPEKLARARKAAKSVEGVVERHFGDRPTLEIVVDALPSTKDRLLLSRKLSFRGDSGIWGVQAKARINTAILAPSSSNPDLIDAIAIGGWIDFRRVRSDSRWSVFRRRRHGTSETSRLSIPLDTTEAVDGPLLLRRFCSENLPPITVSMEPNGEIIHELGPSSLGNAGAFTLFSGWYDAAIGTRYGDDLESRGEFGALVSAPVETLIFDFLVHRDLEFALQTSADVYGTIGSTWRSERDRLPLEPKKIELGRFPPVVDTPLIPRYSEIVDFALATRNWSRSDFFGRRYTLAYPPFPSSLKLSFPLLKRP